MNLSQTITKKSLKRVDSDYDSFGVLDSFRQAAAPLFFLNESKYSAAAATACKILPRLFRFTFSHVTVWSLYSPLVFTLLLLPRYFSVVEPGPQ